MKKRLCIIVAAMLAFSMTACTSSGDSVATVDTQEEVAAPETAASEVAP